MLFLLLPLSCFREEEQITVERLPDGTPVMLTVSLGVPDPYDVEIGTKAEASRADESRVHDLYVMLFDQSGNKFYGRYFTYEHLSSSLATLDSQNNEGWYVENSDNSKGAVKIATVSKESCTLVVLANVSNTITSLNGEDPVECLYEINTWSQLQNVRVTLEQEVVNRSDLFLMMGYNQNVDTGGANAIKWGDPPGTYSTDPKSKIDLKILDAKVKFYVTYDKTENIDPEKSYTRYWKVFNVPTESFLFSKGANTSDVHYFQTEKTYFEGTQVIHDDVLDQDVEWQVFSFYMLENLQSGNVMNSIEDISGSYYLREKQNKMDTVNPETGFKDNLDYIYAPANATYVQFDVVLGLTPDGILSIDPYLNANHALTSEAQFTVHLGNFNDPVQYSGGHNYDDYDVKRGHFYNYYITINNTQKIYIEVTSDDEQQPAQEGSLLLATDDIVNCDAHYEYYALTFNYSANLVEDGVSWYVKSPFVMDGKGGATWNDETKDWDFDCDDYLWVKFSVNELEGGSYKETRMAYPGYDEDDPTDYTYDPGWEPDPDIYPGTHPELMDIHQLIRYIFDQTRKKKDGHANDFRDEVIRVTAFIDEYYYEKNPVTKEKDPELWRKFVNAEPRELHILSNAQYSSDGKSDVITSSHSIIQQSIQTFYNIYSPDLSTIWGTEHVDEMSYANRLAKDPAQAIWPWWPERIEVVGTNTNHISERDLPTATVPNDSENGRYNTAAIWGVDDSNTPEWDTFVDYSVTNTFPELRDDYHYLAYSCLTRNRDNDGDGFITKKELRWYMASVNQLVGLWVGNESISPSARLYQPKNKKDKSDGLQWRSWVISSTASNMTNPNTIRAEEGATKSDYNTYEWADFSVDDRHEVSSVRCVRNLGTYTDGGELKDISEAPLDFMVDQYYDAPAGLDANGKVKPNADGTYTLNFYRLNPKSIRGYTQEDLPYHEEYSMHNCVYLELNMQDPTNRVLTDGTAAGSVGNLGLDEEEINLSITNNGHNNFCPPGYRLPNMTEMLLMVAMQPSAYWTAGADYPTRTYFSRGKRGSNKTDSEEEKIGWGYTRNSNRFHMLHEGNTVKGVRCVRDNNRTGDITGRISVPNWDKLHIGDDFTTSINFTSMGSAINTVNLYIVYTNTSGEVVPRLLKTINLSAASVIEDVDLTVPRLPILGNMFMRAEVINNATVRRYFETPIRIVSDAFASVRLLPCEYDEDDETPPFPLLVTASSPDDVIASWKLLMTDPYGDSYEYALAADTRDSHHWAMKVQFDDYTIGQNTSKDLVLGTYKFQLEVTTDTGGSSIITRSDVASMDVILLDEQFNSGTVGVEYNEASDITEVWEPYKVEDIYFFSGDFIEANMDVSSCTYLEVLKPGGGRDDNRTIGRDNLISVGITGTDTGTGMTVPYVYHIYYPAQDGAYGYLRPNISTSTGSSNGYNYSAFSGGAGTGFELATGSKYMPNAATKQHFRLEKSGAFWNNQWINPALWSGSGANAAKAQESLTRILNSNTLFVGSTQGYHHSRAKYHFVRAVHNSAASNPSGGSSSFENDPVNGGSL